MSSARIYANPIVGRTGLANMLFVWARAEVFCQRHGASMLAPQWVNVFRVGPWFRFERDKRYYFANFSQEGMVHGLKRFVILRALRHVDESVAEREGNGTADGGRVVDFRGMAHFFDPLLGDQLFLQERLHAIAAPAVRRMLEVLPPEPFLGVHVRRGDFRQGGLAIDDAWYIRAVSQALRAAFPDGGRPQIRIFSDAAPPSLRFLAEAFPNVTIQPKAPALLDLLHLSRCAALVGTSRSTFGMWAAFLGQMPSFWHPVETPPLLSVTQRAVVTVVD